MKEWLNEILAIGKIKPNKPPYISLVLMAEKPYSDKLRPYMDYR